MHVVCFCVSENMSHIYIIEKAGMTSCKPTPTLVYTKQKLSVTSSPSYVDPSHYRSLGGALQYLIFTRPDITYAIQHMCLFMHDLRDEHMIALKRVVTLSLRTFGL